MAEYEIIKFTDKSYGRGRSKKAAKPGKYLCLAYSDENEHRYKIYHIQNGQALFNFYWVGNDGFDEAIKFIMWIEAMVGDYFLILDFYPEIDLFNLIKWTIEDGIQLYEATKLMNQCKEMTLGSVASAFHAAKGEINNWTREFNDIR